MKKDEREVIEGYTVISSVEIGGRCFIYGKDLTGKKELPYMKCSYRETCIGRLYEGFSESNRFETIMLLFSKDIHNMAAELEAVNREMGEEKYPPFSAQDVIPLNVETNLTNTVVAIDTKYLGDGYKSKSRQLYYVTGGNGTRGTARGTGCFCYDLCSGEKDRIERYEVMGIVPQDKLPDFALKTLEEIKRKEKNKDREER